MKRLLLYVHYNKYDELSGHVLYQLEQLRPLFSKLIVISNSQLTKSATVTLEELGIAEVIQRENLGFDFAAWRDGMAHVGFEHLTDFDSVTLMNDTCFGPLWDLSNIVEGFEQRQNVDFWGMTNFRKTKYFDEHLQSYFMFFKSLDSTLKRKNIEILISCFTETNPGYEEIKIRNARFILNDLLAEQKQHTNFIVLNYYLFYYINSSI